MRARLVVLVLAILLVAGFAALNWPEFVRPAPLLFGAFVMDAPLGLLMLALLGLALVAFLISSATMATRSLVETRDHHRTLERQRDLADRAEASRFTELRTHLDTQLRELRQRDTMAASEFEKAIVQSQRELRAQLEQINRTLAARMAELEHRLDARFDRLHGAATAQPPAVPATATRTTDPLVRRETVHPGDSDREHAFAQRAQSEAQVRAATQREDRARAELRERERDLQEERTRAQRDRERDPPKRDARPAGERSTESGWRRWF